MRYALGLLFLAMVVFSSVCGSATTVPEAPGLYVLNDSGQIEQLHPLAKPPSTQDALEELFSREEIVTVPPSIRFLLFEPNTTMDSVRNGFWMNIGFMFFDPGAVGGRLGPEIRPIESTKGLWELSFPQLASMRSCILSIAWQPEDDLNRKYRGQVWVDGVSPESVRRPPSLFDTENYEAQMMSSIVAEQNYSLGEEINVKIPRGEALRLTSTGNHPSNVREIVIYPFNERLYIRCAWIPVGCAGGACDEAHPHSQTSQPALTSRAHWTTVGPNHRLGIGTMWNLDSESVDLWLRTRTMKGLPR